MASEDHMVSREPSPAGGVKRHTEGPWQPHDDYTREGRLTIIGGIDGPDDGVFHFTTVCEVDDSSAEPDEALANAQLIAAAPDLLSALRALSALFDDYRESDLSHADAHNILVRYPAWEAARNALAKAGVRS